MHFRGLAYFNCLEVTILLTFLRANENMNGFRLVTDCITLNARILHHTPLEKIREVLELVFSRVHVVQPNALAGQLFALCCNVRFKAGPPPLI